MRKTKQVKMKQAYLLLVALFITELCAAQHASWHYKFDGNIPYYEPIEIMKISPVDQGSCVMLGVFNDTLSFQGNTAIVNGLGYFAARFDPNGNLQWFKMLPGKTNSLMTDANGNIYLGGSIDTTVIILGNSYTPAGEKDAYFAKLNSNGDFLWFKTISTTGNDEATDLVMGSDGLPRLTGYIGHDQGMSGTLFGLKSFVRRLDHQGNTLTEYFIEGGGSSKLRLDADNNLYLFIHHNDTLTVDGVTILPGDDYYGGVSLLKLMQDGSFGWHHYLFSHFRLEKYDAAVTSDKRVLVTYYQEYGGSVMRVFGEDGTQGKLYSFNTNLLVRANSMQLLAGDRLLFTGHLTTGNSAFGGAQYQPAPLCSDTIPHPGMIIVETDSTLGCINHIVVPHVWGLHVAAAQDNSIYVTGVMPSNSIFGSTDQPDWSKKSLFAASFNDLTGIRQLAETGKSTFEISPNPSGGIISITHHGFGSETLLCIYSTDGKCVKQESLSPDGSTIDIGSLGEGIYFVTLTNDEGVATRKLVVSR